jgi:hypothetical protein
VRCPGKSSFPCIPFKIVTKKDSLGILALLSLHDLGNDVWLSPNSTDEYQQLSKKTFSAGILEQSKEAGNRVGIRLSYRPARLQRLAESIPVFHKSLKIPSPATLAAGIDSMESIPGLLKV